MKVTALFDGDILAYRAGFAAEKSFYFDKRKPPEDGGQTWTYKKEVVAHIPEEYIDKGRDLEPIENAYYNVKSLINKSLSAIETHYNTDDIFYETFVTGNHERPNFRKAIDSEYKANRKDTARPTYLPELLEYIITNHNGYSSEGCEADDFFGHASVTARSNDRTPVVITIDKDLKQIAGHHYHPVKDSFFTVSENEADLMFWRQMLQGDAADNIIGIHGIGDKKSKRYLPDGTTNEKAQEVVIPYYQRDFGENWEERYNRNAALLWIWKKIPDKCPYKI